MKSRAFALFTLVAAAFGLSYLFSTTATSQQSVFKQYVGLQGTTP